MLQCLQYLERMPPMLARPITLTSCEGEATLNPIFSAMLSGKAPIESKEG
jgi:hypothetical protein